MHRTNSTRPSEYAHTSPLPSYPRASLSYKTPSRPSRSRRYTRTSFRLPLLARKPSMHGTKSSKRSMPRLTLCGQTSATSSTLSRHSTLCPSNPRHRSPPSTTCLLRRWSLHCPPRARQQPYLRPKSNSRRPKLAPWWLGQK